jgi:plastocyanin
MEPLGHTLEALWNGILDLSAQIVTPDWAALVALMPVGLAVLVVLFFGWLLRLSLRTGPRRRRARRRAPVPPPGTHAPGPSWAPVLGAIGLFGVFFGLVFGGPWLLLGLALLAAALLYWLREGMRDYEHLERAEAAEAAAQPPVPAEPPPPPPGVHVPAPSFRPILAAAALMVVFYGLVFGGWLLPAGIAVLVIVLAGWLRDARREYLAVEAADRTGHLDSGPPPGYPTGTLLVSLLIVAAAVVVDAGLLPPRSAVGGEPGASAAPSAAPSAGPSSQGPSPEGSAGPSIPVADATIRAQGIQFLDRSVVVPAGRPFTIAFVNLDAGVPHNVDIRSEAGENLFVGEIFNGVDVRVYDVPALVAGTYPFVCTVHPNMTGTITAR